MNFLRKLILGCKALSVDCHDASCVQSEMLDHPLSPPKRVGLWLHLALCKWCRRYGKQIRFLRDAACEHQEELAEAAPQKLSSEARDRIKRRLNENK